MRANVLFVVAAAVAALSPSRTAGARKRPVLTSPKRPVPAVRCANTDPAATSRCRLKRTKKARWLCLKAVRRKHKPPSKGCYRPARRRSTGQISPAGAVVNLLHVHTREVLPVVRGCIPGPRVVRKFLRCRWTGKRGRADLRTLAAVLQAARHFGADTVKILSAYRHPKFNEYLRKKCREVARLSRHTSGEAIDFALSGVDTKTLYAYLVKLRFGGVGTYPGSGFVHLDSGPVRTWKGL